MLQNFATGARYEFQSLEEAFPGPEQGCDPLTDPLPTMVMLQIRRAKEKTAGGIVLTKETKEAEAANTQVAKVLAIGSMCFKNPDTAKDWPEGPWFAVGDYLRIPKFNGFRFSVKWRVPKEWDREQPVEDIGFVMFAPSMITGKVRGDPRAITNFA